MHSDALLDRLARLVSLFDQGGIVYLVTCLATGPDQGKEYVGLTTGPLSLREYGHIVMADTTKYPGPLYEVMRKYQPPGKYFKWEILGSASNWEELREVERVTIRERGSHISLGRGFNLTWGGEGVHPLKRLTVRVQNEIFRQRGNLEGGNVHARKDFAKRYGRRWNSLNETDKACLIEHHAIRSQFLDVFREHATVSLLKRAAQVSDSAITDAVERILQQKPELADAELTEYLRFASRKSWIEEEG